MPSDGRNIKDGRSSGAAMLRNIGPYFMLLKGYHILVIRYRTRLWEIDLIAHKKDVVAIVEVKARPPGVSAVDAVGFRAQQRIRVAADF